MLINFRPRKTLNYLTPIEVLLNKRVSLIAAI
jgi:IS30 family transposase